MNAEPALSHTSKCKIYYVQKCCVPYWIYRVLYLIFNEKSRVIPICRQKHIKGKIMRFFFLFSLDKLLLICCGYRENGYSWYIIKWNISWFGYSLWHFDIWIQLKFPNWLPKNQNDFWYLVRFNKFKFRKIGQI